MFSCCASHGDMKIELSSLCVMDSRAGQPLPQAPYHSTEFVTKAMFAQLCFVL